MAEELEIPVADNETGQNNDPLGILTPKKQHDNPDPLGILKKKVDGNVSNNGTSNTSQSKLPSSPSIFQEGTDNANNNIFKQIGKQVTPELQQRHDDILKRSQELNAQPKNPSPLQKFDNMAANILGFNRDLTGSINPKKVAEIDHDINGHWGNIVQNVFAKIEKTGTDIASGTLGLISDAEQAQNPVKLHGTPMEQLISGLNGNKQRLQQVINNNQLPNTFLGNTVNSLASITPDIIGAVAAPEAKIAEGAGLLAKAGGLLFNKFTNYLIGKGVVTNYGEARQSGQEPGEAIIPAIKGGLEGAKQGIELALLGAGSGLATKGIMAQAEKAGLIGAKGVATRQLVGLSTDLVAYAGIQPTLSAAEEGRFPTMKEIADGAGIAAAFRIKGGAEELKSHSNLNKAIEETQNQRQGIAIANFVDADHDAIKTVYDQPETAQELNLQALDAAKKAKETTDLSKKQEYVAQAITLTKASNVKSVADMVLNNPQGLEDFKNSPDIPDAVKQQFLQKAQEVSDILKPKENVPHETVPEGNITQDVNNQSQLKTENNGKGKERGQNGGQELLTNPESENKGSNPKEELPLSTPISKEGSGSVEGYKGEHQIKNAPTTADKLDGGNTGFDWKEVANDHDLTDPATKESYRILKTIKDNPDAEVTVYRSVPKGIDKINEGDWVTLSKTYAKEHGMHESDPSQDMPVISMKVKAKDIGWDGNDLNEFILNTKNETTPTEVSKQAEGEKPIVEEVSQDKQPTKITENEPTTNSTEANANTNSEVKKEDEIGSSKPLGNNQPPTDNTTSTNQDEGSGNTGVVGMTRAIMKQEKIDSNLTDAENLFIGSTDKKAWDNVNKKIEANPNLYQERINATFGDALNGERPKVSDEDALIGLHEKVRLRIEHNEISQQIADAKLNGNNLDVVSLELQKEAIENKQIENKQFIKLVGSSGGKLLRSVGFLSGEDYSFAGLTHDIETEQGSKLTPEQKERFRKLADEHSKLVKELADLHEKIKVDEDKRSKDEEISRAKFEEDTIARLKIEAEKDKNKPSKPARNKEVVKAELDKAREQFRKDSQQLSSGGLQSIESFVKVVKLAVEYGVKSAAEFIKQFKDDFEGYSEQEIKDAYENVANPNNFKNLADKAAKLSEGELHEGMKPIIDKMLKAIVVDNPEITHVEAVDKIYNALTDAIPDLNRDEVRDLISGYGKYKLLNKEQVPTAIREIKTQNRLDAALDAVKEKNELPLRSGMERHEKTEATRKKEAEILRIIKEKGLTPELSAEDIDRQYKSAEATYQKRIENAIADIEKEIETGEKKKKANPKEYNSERSKQLKEDLEKLKEIRDAKFSEPVKSAGEKKIDALRKKRDDILYKNEGTPKEGESFTEEEQAEIEKLNDEIFEAKKLSGKIKGKDFKTDAEKRVESENNKLENLKNKLDDLIAGKVKEKKINESDSKEVKNLKEQIKAIEHPAKTAEEIASSKESAKEKATQKVIDDINKEIDLLKNGKVPEGEPTVRTKEGKQIFSFKKNKPDKITNDRIKELEALKENLQDEKSNLIPSEVKKQAIILKERTNRQRRLENLETQVKEGNYSPKPKPEAKPYDKQLDETNLKIKKLESIVANEKEKIRLTNRGNVEKTIDGLSQYQRFMIFLNPWGMGRLAYAAIFRPVMKVPTEMAKYALSKLPVTSRIMEKSIGMYRPTLGSAARATKNYYSTLIAKTTFKDALSEYNRRSNFSLRNDAEATDRYNGKLGFTLAAPEMTHGFMKSFPKISAYESTYRAALENLNNTTDPRTGKPYDITDPTVRQIAIEEAQRDAYADVFMSQSELSKMSNKMLSGMASSENMAIQAAGLYGKQLQPVLRVPANFYHEVLQGLPVIGMLDAAQVVARSGEKGAKKLNDGSYRGIDNLTPEQAHKAARAMVNQAVGLMMVGVAVALYKKYGDDLVKKVEEYKYWIHNTGLPLLMMGFNIGKDLKKDDSIGSAVTKSAIHTTVEETTKMPQLKAAGQVTKLSWAAAKAAAGKSNWDGASKQGKEMLASLLVPAGAAELAKRMDDNKKRDPKTFKEVLEMRVPGLRKLVHLKGNAGAGGSWVRPK